MIVNESIEDPRSRRQEGRNPWRTRTGCPPWAIDLYYTCILLYIRYSLPEALPNSPATPPQSEGAEIDSVERSRVLQEHHASLAELRADIGEPRDSLQAHPPPGSTRIPAILDSALERADSLGLPSSLILALLKKLSEIEIVGVLFRPLWESRMRREARKNLREVFGQNHSISSTEELSRLIRGWTSWTQEEENAGGSLRDFLEKRRESRPDHQGTWTLETLLNQGKPEPQPEGKTYEELDARADFEGLVSGHLSSRELRGLISLAHEGVLPQLEVEF